jgi:hypothetical protein
MANEPTTFREDIASQRDFVRARVPVYAKLIELVEAELDRSLEARLAEVWRDRRFGAFYERPLLLLGALRDDALREGQSHPLWRAIASPVPELDSVNAAALSAALAPERSHLWRTLAVRHLQTNEPTRAVAWLWPACIAAEAMPGRALALFDVGASAGLNLIADRLPPVWQRDDGGALDVAPRRPIVARVGFDLRPLDVLDEEDARWLRACVWPGQASREVRLAEAIAAFRTLQQGPDAPEVRTAEAGDVPGLLPRGDDGRLALVYQTIVRDYLPPEEWARYASGLEAWLESRPPGSGLWAELEVVAEARRGGPPAAITLHAVTAGGLRSWVLAHCEPHPRRISVDEAAVRDLSAELRACGSRA